MELITWWMMPLMAILVVITLFLARAARTRRNHARRGLPLANSFSLLALTEDKLFLKINVVLPRTCLVVCILSMFRVVLITARPATFSFFHRDVSRRDIVLSLEFH